MNVLEKYQKDYAFMVEAGFIAINQMDEVSALKLFKAAETLQPKNQLSQIGYGMIYLHKMETEKAIACFQKALKNDPTNEMAKTFMGLAYSLSSKQREKSNELLKETSASEDPLIKKLASTAMEFVELHTKKTKTPFETLATTPRKSRSKRG